MRPSTTTRSRRRHRPRRCRHRLCRDVRLVDDPTAPPAGPPANVDPAKAAHGPGETRLSGTSTEKATAAALKAVRGASVIRVESDAQGAAYEAHLQKADGSYVTVKLGADHSVARTLNGFGGGPGGPGTPPVGAPAA